MHRNELKAILDTTGYKAAFNKFKKPPTIPYILFMRAGSSNIFADNRVFKKRKGWHVVLVTTCKDEDAESRLEDAMDAGGICYDILDETEIEEEGLYQVIYEFECLEG